ncbi:hypothetical protein [Cellulomonas aerilata]|uniref:Di-and tripeptidase n=1 Tax=Cellulomonas aerilata TaxID=515326 RepID=A0A512DDL1_9CELL|nr:hypothetical protein [Cellulomonas aerilata]GEO34545.1 hypothetical protein CAE01nite_22700 [Cellulomonas aerilata]
MRLVPSLRRKRPSDRELSRRTPDDVTTAGPEPEGPHLSRRGPLEALLDRAVTVPSSAIHAHVQTLRTRNPHASPEQIIGLLEKEYLRVVSAAGGAVGAAASVPVGGTGVAVGLTAGDIAAFFAASGAFSLAVASVHGIEVQDADRRRTLLLTTVLGEDGARELGEAIQSGSGAAARTLLTRMPTTTINAVNGTLTRRLVRRQVAKRGALVFGRLVPFGVGAWIGLRGARSLGRTVIEGARATFGPPPREFPRVVQVVEPGGTSRLVGAEQVDSTLDGSGTNGTPTV